MTDPRITLQERVQALMDLEAKAFQLNQIASWLGECGLETEADMIERAARDVLAGCWMLNRPLRAAVPPERWNLGGETAHPVTPALPPAQTP